MACDYIGDLLPLVEILPDIMRDLWIEGVVHITQLHGRYIRNQDTEYDIYIWGLLFLEHQRPE